MLFIAVDDLRNDLGALGSAQALTPQLDAFARTARVFSHHYVQVPTCGASRCALMRGCYPTSNAQVGNDAIKRTHPQWSSNSLPALFHEQGYRTLALGKITHYPGGLTGKDWAEGPQELPGVWDRAWIPQSPWKTAQAMMHGYANGVPRRPGKSPAWEAYDGPDDAYPDAWVAEEAVKTIGQLAADEQPWFFGVGFFKPHLPFAAPKKWHDLHAAVVRDLEKTVAAKPEWPSGWHASGEFRGNYGHQPGQDPNVDMEYARLLRRAYAGGISYVDAQIGRLLDALHQSGLEQDTIVVIWGDHGFLLGEHAIWGKHCLYEQAVRSPLMIRCPGLVQPGQTTSALVESVDVLPTLVDLCELPSTPVTDGRSLRAQLEDPARPSSKLAHSFWSNGQRTVRSDRWRLIVQSDDRGTPHRIELFDYSTDPNETRNHADTHPEVVQDMLAKLDLIPDFRPAARPAAKPNGRSETEKGQ
ncbi:MAG: sulfatase [Aureliella sp.]